jgi:uncharacterized integral membrane protein
MKELVITPKESRFYNEVFMSVKQFFVDVFTGIDGESFDIGRVLWAIGALVYCFLTVFVVVNTEPPTFDYVSWGTGFGAVMAAGGAALWMKKDTEPKE